MSAYQLNFVIVGFIGIFQGLFLSALFLFKKGPKKLQYRLLSCLLLGTIYMIFNDVIVFANWRKYFSLILGTGSIPAFLIGPIFYFYIKHVLGLQNKISLKDLFHFIPLVLYLMIHTSGLIKPYQSLIFQSAIYGTLYIFIVWQFHPLIYLIIARKKIKEYIAHYINEYSSSEKYLIESSYKFLTFYLLFVITSVIILVVSNFIEDPWAIVFPTSIVMLTCLVMMINFFGLNHWLNHLVEVKKKYEHSDLSDLNITSIKEKLATAMTIDQLFIRSKLSLKDLSNHLNCPINDISQVINDSLNTTFYEYINRFRLEKAKQDLLNPQMFHFTIVAIAEDAGFSSKDSFYRTFKRECGLTPTQFRKQNQMHIAN